MRRICFLTLCLASLVSCVRPPVTRPELALEQVSWWRAGFSADDLAFKDLGDAARRSMEYYQKLPPDAVIAFGPEQRTAAEMANALSELASIAESLLAPEKKVERIKEEFDLYRSVGANGWGKVLFTGYYEPVISCRRAQDATFAFPLYKRPDDIIEVDLAQFGDSFGRDRIFGRLAGKKIVPYYSRQEIDRQNALSNRNLELLWCADPVDVYFVQVQGSGKADLGNGERVGILYDGQNGRPYRSIGKYLIDSGAIPREKMSMAAVRDYLRANPDRLFAVLDQNPSYVFFRLDAGPSVGSIGAPLTPGRSIATDSRLFPKGAPALIRTEKPVIADDGSVKDWKEFTRIVANQDTGGAIRGPGRVDLFWGQGRDAEIAAGFMQQQGKLYFLLRKKE